MLRKILFTGFLVLFCFSGFMMLRQWGEYHKADVSNQEAVQLAGMGLERLPDVIPDIEDEIVDEPAVMEPEQEQVLPEEARMLFGMDLQGLQSENQDVIGWIMLSGTDISYPLLQGGDNAYYLSHSWSGEEQKAGSIFLDYRNASAMSDFCNIIYGHRMKDGGMFGALSYYEQDPEFLADHDKIWVRNGDSVFCYQVLGYGYPAADGAVYQLDSDGILEFLAGLGLDVAADDQVLLLSTCTGSGYETRLVVCAVLESVW